jgi:hypothetical protein
MLLQVIENLPKQIQKAVFKARAAAALVPQFFTSAMDAE